MLTETDLGDLRALTITQPWASLVAHGLKRIETRSWPITRRGWIAIHAGAGLGKHNPRRLKLMVERGEPMATAMKDMGYQQFEDLPRGAIIAVAKLVDCVPTEIQRQRVSLREYAFGNYDDERFAWLLDDIRLLPTPVASLGALGFWPVPAPLRQAICASLAGTLQEHEVGV